MTTDWISYQVAGCQQSIADGQTNKKKGRGKAELWELYGTPVRIRIEEQTSLPGTAHHFP